MEKTLVAKKVPYMVELMVALRVASMVSSKADCLAEEMAWRKVAYLAAGTAVLMAVS